MNVHVKYTCICVCTCMHACVYGVCIYEWMNEVYFPI